MLLGRLSWHDPTRCRTVSFKATAAVVLASTFVVEKKNQERNKRKVVSADSCKPNRIVARNTDGSKVCRTSSSQRRPITELAVVRDCE